MAEAKYRVKGHGRTVFAVLGKEIKDDKVVITCRNEVTGGMHYFYEEDLLPVKASRKYESKLPEELRIPEGRTPKTIEAFGQSVTLL